MFSTIRFFFVSLFFFSCALSANSADVQNFDTYTDSGAEIELLLNYDSFVEEGFTDDYPSFTLNNMSHAISIAISNWIQVTGMDLRVSYGGRTDRGSPGNNQIIIRADTKTSDSLLARTSSGYLTNKSHIRFYKSDSADSNYNWSVFPDSSNPGTISFLSILMHELGHSWGLDDNSNYDPNTGKVNSLRSIMGGGSNYVRFGPFGEDIDNIIQMYGYRDALDIDVRRSTNQGKSWEALASNINSASIKTAMPLSVSRDDARMFLFYTTLDKKPARVSGSIDALYWGSSSGNVFLNLESLYGTAGHGYDDEYMMTWVDKRDDNQVKVVRSQNGGSTWYYKNPPTNNFQSKAGGTPAVHKLSDNKWILTYTKLESEKYGDHGRVVSRISINDGDTWGPEVELLPDIKRRAVGGVSVSSTGEDNIHIAYTTINNNGSSGAVASYKARLDDSNKLIRTASRANTQALSILSPSIAGTYEKYYMAYRGTIRELLARSATPTGTSLDNRVVVSWNRHAAAPAVVARRTTAWVYMFSLEED